MLGSYGKGQSSLQETEKDDELCRAAQTAPGPALAEAPSSNPDLPGVPCRFHFCTSATIKCQEIKAAHSDSGDGLALC